MAYEAKPGTFSLFKNQNKQKDTHPDYSGDGKDFDGNEIYVSAWLKDGKNGKFMSCSFKLKDAKPAAKQAPAMSHDDLADTIPF
jgi:hypothetical protein